MELNAAWFVKRIWFFCQYELLTSLFVFISTTRQVTSIRNITLPDVSKIGFHRRMMMPVRKVCQPRVLIRLFFFPNHSIINLRPLIGHLTPPRSELLKLSNVSANLAISCSILELVSERLHAPRTS